MIYRRYRPPAPLGLYVECFWYSEGFEGAHAYERLLPNGESGMVIDLREAPVRIFDGLDIAKFESYAPAIFCGARTDCFAIDTSRQERVIGIQFRAGGAFPFLRMPADEAANATFHLDDVWPGQAGLLREELLAANGIGRMFAILERALMANLRRDAGLSPAMRFAAGRLSGTTGNLRVRDLAERVGMSSRRFLDVFRAHTGLTPKAFQRVRRFQQALDRVHREARSGGTRGDRDWAGMAADCGYYDQPHFIHDFRLFSGMTPGQYLAQAGRHRNHVPIG